MVEVWCDVEGPEVEVSRAYAERSCRSLAPRQVERARSTCTTNIGSIAMDTMIPKTLVQDALEAGQLAAS